MSPPTSRLASPRRTSVLAKPDRQAGDIQPVRTTAAQPRPTAGPNGLGRRVLLGELLKDGFEPTPQLLEGLIYAGRTHSIAGPAGKGKTILAVCIGLWVILGKRLPVLYLDAENGPKVI